ncbi:DNA polymerase [Flavobacterium sharifuzzamanii]|uniref:DNA polymerase n=1 Tax=Flavobacterium sharifuzzamanii TaxID=2211133 RepID=UPI000DAC647F|nr:DNA polymerase [Flavobacterium sharifuzzamanii]KAF2082089.1 hypothetical protein DMA14_06355 [Flavobacterium sharifuzzamanii]
MEIIIIKYTSFDRGKETIQFYTKIVGHKFKIYNDLSFLDKNTNTTIISFEYVNILNDVCLNNNFQYLDIESLKKQLEGRSKIEFKLKQRPWNVWVMIQKLNPEDFKMKKSEFEQSVNNAKAVFMGLNSKETPVNKTYPFLLECIEKIYLNLKSELSTSNEKERYEKVESKMNNVLFEASRRGIRINIDIVKKHIENINIKLYETKNKLQLQYGIFSLNDYENIKANLSKENRYFEELKVNSKKFWKAIKLTREKSELIELLYLERKYTTNKTILTRIGSLDKNYVNPLFEGLGTITGRIIVNSPSLQQLHKDYRDVIIPEQDKELIYIDYCQFEAGILAHEADDEKLIQMYNTNDIYTEISKKLGDTVVSRDLAKKLFFSYCYGMSKENILAFSGHDLNIFFNEFASLEIYEKGVLENFLRDGYVDTILGNRRYKSLKNVENIKENWIISQRIQGVASLILKDVILSVYNSGKDIEFLLPMHDAILYQIPKDKIEDYTKFIIERFEFELKKYFNKLTPKASIKKFTDR